MKTIFFFHIIIQRPIIHRPIIHRPIINIIHRPIIHITHKPIINIIHRPIIGYVLYLYQYNLHSVVAYKPVPIIYVVCRL